MKLRDRDEREHRILLQSDVIHTQRVLYVLEGNGFALPSAADERKTLQQYLRNSNIRRRVCLVQRPGWFGQQFTNGIRSFGQGIEELVIGDQLGQQLANVSSRGTLEEWKTEVARRCASSSYLVYAVCLAFAAPLLKLTGHDSGGSHLYGKTSRWKTTAQQCAATVHGDGRRSGGYMGTWKTTLAGVDETALGHCDLPLVLDELNLLDADQKIAAQKAADVAYSIASGTGKTRSVKYSGRIPQELREYRTLILSSGELSLNAHAQAGGRERLGGAETRLSDIPIPEGRTGIFDRLDGDPKRSQRRGKALRLAVTRFFGTAGTAFLVRLTRDTARDEAALKSRLDTYINRFLKRYCIDRDDPYQVRFASRFALCYAAGLLAKDYEIVPWTRRLIRRCIARCYKRAVRVQTKPTTETPMAVALDILRQAQSAQGIMDLINPSSKVTAAEIIKAPILLVRHTDGRPMLAIQPDVFRFWVGRRASSRVVARELEQMQVLISRGHGKRTRQIRIPGTRKRLDYYCIRPPAVAENSRG